MNISEEAILKALATVEEPDLKRDLVSLGMIKDLTVKDLEVSFTIILTTPACPLKNVIQQRCEDAIHQLVDENLSVVVTFTSNVTTVRTDDKLLPQVKNIIAVASGKGGVGKSTVTANLAVALHRSGAKVGIIDADIFGPSIPTMFGAEGLQPLMERKNGKDYIVPIQQFGIQLMSIGFLTPPDQAVVWRGPMASSALRQFITDVSWGELDYLLVDLPPGTSDIHITLVDALPITGAVIVTTPQKVSLIDAIKAIAMFNQVRTKVPILGVVENMAYFTPAELPDNKYYIFGKDGGKKLAEQLNIPVLGQIPIVQSIREAGDEGRPAVVSSDVHTMEAFKDMAENVARQVAIRNAGVPELETILKD
ncbi:MAG: Mrp/NBP35 family ATP-binding protein [Verrucomicrobia bacterium]|nr:Mrp/NBP35 family ATP-binding protein [Cytophagales bacterium]